MTLSQVQKFSTLLQTFHVHRRCQGKLMICNVRISCASKFTGIYGRPVLALSGTKHNVSNSSKSQFVVPVYSIIEEEMEEKRASSSTKSKKKITTGLKVTPEAKLDRKSRSRTKKEDSGENYSVQGDSGKLDRKKSQRRSKTRSSSSKTRKVPPTPAPSKADLFQADDDIPIEGPDTDVPQPPAELTTHEWCQEVMEEFRLEAEETCIERFRYEAGPRNAVFELRDTWLRIVEAEWMDEARVTQSTLPASFFLGMRDEPPLPMSFDCWSKGSLEILPHDQREPVMDPFIHSLGIKSKSVTSSFENLGGGDGFATTSTSSFGKGFNGSISKFKSPKIPKPANKKEVIPRLPVQGSKTFLKEGDGLHNKSKVDMKNSGTSVSKIISASASIQSSDIDFIKPAVSITSSRSIQYKQLGIKPWTVSQCGGKDGTGGCYRLINQTTSEAIGKGANNDPQEKRFVVRIKNSKELIEESDMMEEIISQSDADTETLYENDQNDETDGTSKSVTNLPSELELPDGADELIPQIPYVDYTIFKKGLLRETKSKQDRERVKEVGESKIGGAQPLLNPKRVDKKRYNYYKRTENKPQKQKELQKTKEFVPQSPNGLDSKAELPVTFVCKKHEDNEVMKEKLAIIKARNDMIQRHRDSVRNRLSTPAR